MHADHEPGRERSVSAAGHARWVSEQLADGRLLELGEAERAGRTWRARGGWRRRRLLLAAWALSAIGCASAGIALLVGPTTVTVSMSESTYRVGDAVLHAIAPGVYTGDGALVIRSDGRGIRAAGSAVVDGRAWVGLCEASGDGTQETCRLQQGGTTVTAEDVWSGSSWERTYSDGRFLEIASARGVPIPFPVGRKLAPLQLGHQQ